MVYGIIELINFAHGDIFMVGAFLSLVLPGGILGAQTGPIDRASRSLIARSLLVALRRSRCRHGRPQRRASSGSPIGRCATRPRLAPADHGDRRLVHPPEHRRSSSPAPVTDRRPRSSRSTGTIPIGGAQHLRSSSIFIVAAGDRPDDRAPAVRRPDPARPGDALDGPGPRGRRADGRRHQPDDRDHVLHRRRARRRGRRRPGPATSATSSSTSASTPA